MARGRLTPAPPAGADARALDRSLRLGAAVAVLGVFADVGATASGPWRVLPELGTPWLLAAFAAGRTWRHRPVAALAAGPAALLLGLLAYAVWVYARGTVGAEDLVDGGGRAGYWLAAALVLGAVMGAAALASCARAAGARLGAWGLVVGVPLAELHRVAAGGYAVPTGAALLLLVTAALVLLVRARREVRSWWLPAAAGGWAVLGAMASGLLLRLA